MKKNAIIYFFIVSIFGILLWLILLQGESLELGKYISTQIPANQVIESGSVWHTFVENAHHPFAILLLQMLTILLTARMLSMLMVKIGQPTVIGEIIAGIMLGPSFLGWMFPSFSAFLFAKDSLPHLQTLSQIGLILFMFIIGMELDLKNLAKTAKEAIVISHASIVFPYFLGVVLAYFLYKNFAPNEVSFLAFALFMGISMSITAFPVLARIVQERGLAKETIGTIVIACAAVDDATAWCLLAIVIAIVKAGSIASAFLTIVFSVVYVLGMIYLVKPFLERLAYRHFTRESFHKLVIAFIFLMLIFSAYLAELIGIHALFGAFIAGLIIPSDMTFRHLLAEKIEDLALVLLLPLFFVMTGLRTQIGLLNEANLWLNCGLIILIAVAGKFLGSALTARFVGQTWKDAMMIGALMNTRGLMELVVLNIGYELGILSPAMFAMMVLMALSTTFMTGPALDLIEFVANKTKQLATISEKEVMKGYKILISFGYPEAGARFLQLVNELRWTKIPSFSIHALHMTPTADISLSEAEIFEKEGFTPILACSEELEIPIETHYKATNNLRHEIMQFANNGNFDLMLMGSSRPLFSDNEMGGKVHEFLEIVEYPLAVLVDKGFQQIRNILWICASPSDIFLGEYVKLFSIQNDRKVTQFPDKNANPQIEGWHLLDLHVYDLILMSRNYWEEIKATRDEWMQDSPSILIVNR